MLQTLIGLWCEMSESRKLTFETKSAILNLCNVLINNPATYQSGGEIIAILVIGLLENAHLYNEWYEDERSETPKF